MSNIRYFNVLVVAATFSTSVLFTGCMDDLLDRIHDPDILSVTELNIEELMGKPYSELTPDEQKVKLELESIELLNQLEAASSMKAIEAFENFIDLLGMDEPEVDEPVDERETGTSYFLTFDVAHSYGVFTWNSATEKWTKSNSNNELKFVFPSDESKTSNNASLSISSINSNSNIVYEDNYTDRQDSEYSYNDRFTINLPGAITGILSVDNKEIAKIEFGVEYEKYDKVVISEGKDDDYDEEWSETVQGSYPVVTRLRITSDDYVYWYSIDGTGKDSRVEMQLLNGDSILIESLFAMDIDFKSLIDDAAEDIEELLEIDKLDANGYMKLMNDLVIVYEIDVANLANRIDAIEEWYDRNYPNSNSQNYYTTLGSNEKKYSDDMTAAINTNMKASLISAKDGYKIADLIAVSEKLGEYYDDSTWNGDYWERGGYWDWDNLDWIQSEYTFKYDIWEPVVYLRFKDNTLVEAEAYFSSGFSALEKRWEDFVNAFDR